MILFDLVTNLRACAKGKTVGSVHLAPQKLPNQEIKALEMVKSSLFFA